jgi:NAD(P)-dependent dehydrogenase (short-subunit alcohol dehydrogenase family)
MRTVIVSGGTGALGVAVTTTLLESDWRVIVPHSRPGGLERLGPNGNLVLVEADLFDQSAAEEVVARAGANLAALVNLVGGFNSGGRLHETPIDDFEAQFRLNLRPTYLLCHAAIPVLLEHGAGSIVCVSTRAALRPFAGAAGYISSKAAILSLVDVLATEYTRDGLRANAILPSVIDTPANRVHQPDEDHSRWVKPEEIARVIRFLISEDSTPTSGAHIPVYGRA